MYDTPGADAGREWVEITNTGSEVIDITGYKFVTDGVKHGLSMLQGTSTLEAGQSAVIVANAEKFAVDWPGFAGALIKSSFTLGNEAETISLLDKDLNPLDVVSYASDAGAAGDGNSLHRVEATVIVGAPNPGAYSVTPPAPQTPPEPEPEPPPPATPDPAPATTTPATSPATTTATTPAQPPPPPPTSAASVPAAQPTVATATTSAASKKEEQKTLAVKPTLPPATFAQSVAAEAAQASVPIKRTSNSSAPLPQAPYAAQAAAAVAATPAAEGSTLWLYALLLGGLLVAGIAAILYVQLAAQKAAVTSSAADEFEIE